MSDEPLDLEAIQRNLEAAQRGWRTYSFVDVHVPALIAEVERLREQVEHWTNRAERAWDREDADGRHLMLLRAEVKRLQVEVEHWKSGHADMVQMHAEAVAEVERLRAEAENDDAAIDDFALERERVRDTVRDLAALLGVTAERPRRVREPGTDTRVPDGRMSLWEERQAERDVIEKAKAWRAVWAVVTANQHPTNVALAAAVDALPQPVAPEGSDV